MSQRLVQTRVDAKTYSGLGRLAKSDGRSMASLLRFLLEAVVRTHEAEGAKAKVRARARVAKEHLDS